MSVGAPPIGGPADSSRLERIYDRAFRESRPLTCLWEVTYDCNLGCRHCYVERDGRDILSLDDCVRVLDDLAGEGVLFVSFTGGEPFARADFIDILRAASAREFAFRVLTNGTLVGEREADALADVAPTSVDFSLYGCESTHDGVTCVAGTYAKTRAAIDMMLARGVHVRIKTPLMRANLAELGDVKDLASSLGAGFVFDATIVCRPSGDRTPLGEQVTDADLFALMRELYEGRDVPKGSNLEGNEPFCSAARGTMRITPSGDVTPCVAIPTSVGSLKGSALAEVWRSPELERFRAMRLADLPECRECEIMEWCTRCPGQALVEDGDIRGPSSAACRLARIFATLAHEADEKEGSV
ncbi:MAG: radical SAM protein [Planctomycetota bacterium]|jgi:radical SAM protein with 4Fe4S-binding SPASM domain